ncbi:MAG: InlB B-repeat-containing protein, partial [Clostridia bacterium]
KMTAGGITLYAVWTANDNSVIFNSNGGVGEIANQIIKTDVAAALTANVFTKTGYTFAGWATTADGAVVYSDGASYTMTAGGITLYAVWTANDNAVIFNANGGVGEIANQIIKTDVAAALTANTTITKAGYTFAGWATTADGAVVYSDGASYTMTAGGITLYAVWTINTYTVNFNYDGASSDTSVTTMQATYDTAFTCPVPTKAEYTFQGWYDGTTQITDNNGASKVTLKGENNAVYNLTAKWIVTMEFNDRDASNTWLTKYNGTEKNVVIPAIYNGRSIIRIDTSAFEGNKTIETIVLPSSVSIISHRVFYGCSNLTGVTIEPNSNLQMIGFSVFYGVSLKEFTLPASLRDICDGIGYNAFIGSKIEKFNVENGNSTFIVKGNCLINKTTKMLMSAAYSSDVIIPTDEGLTSIAIGAFYDNDKINKVVIPNTVTTIGASAFYCCYKLKSVTIPTLVTKVGYNAFFNVFTTIYYEGATIPVGTTSNADWSKDWKTSQVTVVTNCVLSADKSYVVSFTRTENNITVGQDKYVNAPYRAGYTFGGWYQDQAFATTPITDIVSIASGTTVYAKWSAI